MEFVNVGAVLVTVMRFLVYQHSDLGSGEGDSTNLNLLHGISDHIYIFYRDKIGNIYIYIFKNY